jgi:hypothetical protein
MLTTWRIPMSNVQQSGCACCGAAGDSTDPGGVVGSPAPPDGDRPDLVCTLDGGPDAVRGRISEWKAVINRATGREPADGGITLVYDHDPALTVELARLAAAEFACCSFFTFTLTVAPDGVRFTVGAPDEARDLVTAVFGAAVSGTGGTPLDGIRASAAAR